MAEIATLSESTGTPGGAAGTEQPSPVSSFSFEGLHEKAMNFQPDAVSTPTLESEHAQTPPVVDSSATNVDNATQAQLAALKDTDLVEVTVDGQSVQLPWSEARGGVMRHAKFTKEMQGLASQRTQFETERASLQQAREEREALVQLLSNKDLLRQFASAKYPDLFQQAQAAQAAVASGEIDPNDIATVGQIQELRTAAENAITNMAQQLEQNLAQREAAIATQIETKQATLKLATQVNDTITSLFKEHPFIEKTIPNAQQLLRYEVSQMKPRTPEEALEAFGTVVAGWKERFDDAVRESTKQTVIAKQKLVGNNIQPPGGSGVQPTPVSFKKTNKLTGKQDLNWDAIHEQAMAFLK
jgi:hypothetical protein